MTAVDQFEVTIVDNVIEVELAPRIAVGIPVPGPGLPTGGDPGQVPVKRSTDDFDTAWEDPPSGLPPGGTTGQSLRKASDADNDARWANLTAGDVGATTSADVAAAVATEASARAAADTNEATARASAVAAEAAARASADALLIPKTDKGIANGVATLGPDGKISPTQVPAIAINDFLGDVGSEAAMLALVGQRGDWCIRTDTVGGNSAWIIIHDDPTQLSSWEELPSPAPGGGVLDVNGRNGHVTGLAEQTSLDAETARAEAGEAAAQAAAEAASDPAGTAAAAIVSPTAAEFIRDTIGAALVAGARIAATVNDAGDTITLAVTGLQTSDLSDFATATDERARDALGAALTAGANITITPNDGADTISVAVSGLTSTNLSDFAEAVQDVVGGFLAAGTGLTVTYNDSGNVETVGIDTSAENERIDDRVAALLVAGSGVALTYNDTANTLTIDAAGTGDVIGPSGATADRVAIFNGTTGKIIKDSGKVLPTGTVVGTSDNQTLTNKHIDGSEIDSGTVAMARLYNAGVPTGNKFLRDDGALAFPHLGLQPVGVPRTSANSPVSAAADDFIPVDLSTGSVVVTLPAAPTTGSLVAVQIVTAGGSNLVTINTSGSDVFAKVGGPTSATLTMLYETVLLQYYQQFNIWFVVAHGYDRAQLDGHYIQQPAGAANDDFLQLKAGVWTHRSPAQSAVDLGIPASLNVLLGSVDVPRRSLDRVRGAPNGVDTALNADITSTATTITTKNVNLVLPGEYPVVQMDAERMLVIRGQGTTTLTVIRHVDGTTAAAHTAGTAIVRDKVRNCVCVGDSATQGTNTSVTGEWDAWVERYRRIANERFGGSLGSGFYGLWRDFGGASTLEWNKTGTWLQPLTSDPWCTGPWKPYYGTTSSAVATWTRPARHKAAQIDVWYVVWSGNTGTGTEWSYSLDNGVTWNDSPGAGVDPHPTATTTLGSADNGRRCDYFDGTKTMTLASVTGIENNGGFVKVAVGLGGSTFRCYADFTYDGVSGSTLTNVKYVGPSMYNALTTTTGDTVQKRAEVRKASIPCVDPATFKIRCAKADGTNRVAMFHGIDVWSSVPVFGTTKGLKVHNFGNSGQGLSVLLNSRMVNDIGTTNGSNAISSGGRAGFSSTDVGGQLIAPGFPAGTLITAVADATHATASNNWTGATVVAGASPNPVTIQTFRGAWDSLLNGCPMSLLPSLIVNMWFVDSLGDTAQNGGDQTITATFASGSASVTLAGGSGAEPMDVGALFADQAATCCAPNTVIATRTDATHITISPAAVASGTAVATYLNAPSASVVQAIKDKLTVWTQGGIGSLGGLSAFADQLLVVGFEQGGTQLDGRTSTSARQADYRQGEHDWATANLVATIDIYKAWSLEGNVGYAAASADGLMDTGDTQQYHQGPVGNRDIASRITRLLEFA